MDRRAFIAGLGTAALGGIAGCASSDRGAETTNPSFDPAASTSGDAPSLEDLPDLSGELTIYLGRGEGGLYKELLDHFETERYPDLALSVRQDSSASLANTIVEEEKHGSSPADVFWSIDTGALGTVARQGLTSTLPTDLTGLVPGGFRDSSRRWVGISGRARAIPYNTDVYDAADVPSAVAEIPETEGFGTAMGWAPTYGAFQSFVTAMRLVRGPEATRAWLNSMLETGISRYGGEFLVTNAVAEGELDAGFANHYYALRLKGAKPDAPLDLAFTSGDSGALINASGVVVLDSSTNKSLANDFIAHLLTREVQSFLAETAFEYPLVSGVKTPASLPPIEQLNPPAIDLTKLSEVRPTLELMRETGVL